MPIKKTFTTEKLEQAFMLRENGTPLSEIANLMNVSETCLSSHMQNHDRARHARLSLTVKPVREEHIPVIETMFHAGTSVSSIVRHFNGRVSTHAIRAFLRTRFSPEELAAQKQQVWQVRERNLLPAHKTARSQRVRERASRPEYLAFLRTVSEKNIIYTPDLIRTKLDSFGVPWQAPILHSAEKVTFVWSDGARRSLPIVRVMKMVKIPHPSVSRPEAELLAWVRTFFPDACRQRIDGREIDIFIPGRSIGIDVGGEFWHSEKKVSKRYHAEKREFFAVRGVHLIQIFVHEIEAKRSELLALICGSTETPTLAEAVVLDLRFDNPAPYLASGWSIEEVSEPELIVYHKKHGVLSPAQYAVFSGNPNSIYRLWDCGKMILRRRV